MNTSSYENTTRNSEFTYIIPWYIASIIISTFGTIGNLWCGSIIIICKRLWNRPIYRLILGIIIPDFVTNSICIPYEATQSYSLIFLNRIIGSDISCAVEGTVFIIAMSMSNINQMIVACYRFCAVVSPIRFRGISTNRMVLILMLSISVAPVLIYFIGGINTLFWYRVQPLIGDCSEYSLFIEIDYFRNSFFQFIPTLISVLAYIGIIFRILFAGLDSNTRKTLLKRAKGSLALGLSMAIYSTCIIVYWMDYNSNNYGYNIDNSFWKKFAIRASYGLTPLFYVTLDNNIRESSLHVIKHTNNKKKEIILQVFKSSNKPSL